MNRYQGILLGVVAVAGSAAAVLTDRRHPVRAGAFGAAAGLAAGLCATVVYDRFIARDDVPYYSSSSPQYYEAESL
jgi:hypothetical protein